LVELQKFKQNKMLVTVAVMLFKHIEYLLIYHNHVLAAVGLPLNGYLFSES